MNQQASSVQEQLRVLTKFPTEGLPAPRPTPALQTQPVRYDGTGRLPPNGIIAINRWWCCQCAHAGFDDPLGIIYSPEFARCWRCHHHIVCHNCVVGPTHRRDDCIRTLGGLHTSPRFLDPVYWECVCGEWVRNGFNNHHNVEGQNNNNNNGAGGGGSQSTRQYCASPGCSSRYGESATLHARSVVMNMYGQRLGTADQTHAVLDGPWHWQRRGLGDPRCCLIKAFRPAAVWKPDARAVAEPILWRDGAPAPRYPFRPPPPLPVVQGGTEFSIDVNYEKHYLEGIPTSAASVGAEGVLPGGSGGPGPGYPPHHFSPFL